MAHVLGVTSTLPSRAYGLFRRHTRIFLPSFIDEFNRSIQANGRGDCRDAFNYIPKLPFALTDSFFGPQAVSDVASNLQQEATSAVRDQAGVYFDREG